MYKARIDMLFNKWIAFVESPFPIEPHQLESIENELRRYLQYMFPAMASTAWKSAKLMSTASYAHTCYVFDFTQKTVHIDFR